MFKKRRQMFCRAALATAGLAGASQARAQIASLDKGHRILVNNGLQIWGVDTDLNYSFDYPTLANANLTAVTWGGASDFSTMVPGNKFGQWVDYTADPNPATLLTPDEQAHMADLIGISVGDEQDIVDQGSADYNNTVNWFQTAQANNYYPNTLLYVNTFQINNDGYPAFIAAANPDAISFDSYPFSNPDGHYITTYNWLSLAQEFRRHALGSYIGATGNAARPYGTYLQTFHDTYAIDPGDAEMRWQQFTAWTMGYTFADAVIYDGGNTNFASQGTPLYSQFKETARQSRNIGPALTHLISTGYGTSIVTGKTFNPANNQVTNNNVPGDWLPFSQTNAPAGQQYLTGISAVNLGTKNGGNPGDVYIGFFNPLLASYGDPSGEAYFMITNGLGGNLLLANGSSDNTALASDCQQKITGSFDFGSSGVTTLLRLSRNTGLVEVVPLTHVAGGDANQYQLADTLDGGTGDLFKFNDGTPFVGAPGPGMFYWDNDANSGNNNSGTGAGMGGSGTWDTSSSKWYNGSGNGAWSANTDPIFWGTAGTVTLGAAQSVNSLSFKSNGYTLTGSTLTMAGSIVSVDSGVTATINSAIAGSAGLIKTGSGTLKLGGTNTFSNGTMINGGVVQVSSDANLGTAPAVDTSATTSNITLNGGTLQFGGSFDISGTRGIVLGPAGGTIDTQGFSTINGYVAKAGGFTGPGNLTKIGSGTFFAAATSGGLNTTWKGSLIIQQGTWKIVATDGLPFNPTLADGLQAAQITLDGGTWQADANINATSASCAASP